jgi:hypothetical protein
MLPSGGAQYIPTPATHGPPGVGGGGSVIGVGESGSGVALAGLGGEETVGPTSGAVSLGVASTVDDVVDGIAAGDEPACVRRSSTTAPPRDTVPV